MSINYKQFTREKLCDNTFFSYYVDDKFKFNRLSIYLSFKEDKENTANTAVLTEILKKSSAKYPTNTLVQKELYNLYGADIDSYILQYKNRQMIGFFLNYLDDRFAINNENLTEDCVELLMELIFNPLISDGGFDKTETEVGKEVLKELVESEINDKILFASRQCKRMVYEDVDVNIDIYGSLSQIADITPQSAYECYKKIIDTAQIEVMFIGSGSPDIAKNSILNKLESKVRHSQSVELKEITVPYSYVKRKTEEQNITQANLSMGFVCDIKKDYVTKKAANFMAKIFGGMPNSKLFKNVREKESLCYYCGASYKNATNVIFVDTAIEEKNKEQAETSILRELQAMQNGEFGEDDINCVKLAYNSVLSRMTDSVGGVENWYLMRILEDDYITIKQEMDIVNSITKEQIVNVAKNTHLQSVYFLKGRDSNVK